MDGVIEPEVVRAAVERYHADASEQRFDVSNPANLARDVTEALMRWVTPEDIGRCVSVLIKATRRHKNSAVAIPDTRAMEAGAKLYLAYAVGLPVQVQRQEIVKVTSTPESEEGLVDRLVSSPAIRKMVREALAKADALVEQNAANNSPE